jgi:hypothetical protein
MKTSHSHDGVNREEGELSPGYRGVRTRLSYLQSECGHFSGSFARILATIAENRVSDATRARSLVKRFRPLAPALRASLPEAFFQSADWTNRIGERRRCDAGPD